ncbi:MAG: tRNA pseudouridine(55) synthase TruB [Nitrospirota bacterium]
MNGFFFIDKEKGMTSFDVVRNIRRMIGEKKVGHSGTLDKLAEGLLIVAVGQGTKLLEYLIGFDKEYEVVGRFGYVSDTFDSDGEVVKTDFSGEVSESEILESISGFTGEISQMPPKYSALKVGGRRASDIVRSGEKVELKARNIRIDDFEIVEYDWPEVRFRVSCSSGTYIRSLINDLGEKLGCGGYVGDLRRTKIGSFSVGDAVILEVLGKNVDQRLISMEEMGRNFATIDLSDEEFEGLKDGKVLLDKKLEQEGVVVAFYGGKAVGVVENDKGGIKFSKVWWS